MDIRQEIKELKGEIVNTLKKYESQLVTIVRDDEEAGEEAG